MFLLSDSDSGSHGELAYLLLEYGCNTVRLGCGRRRVDGCTTVCPCQLSFLAFAFLHASIWNSEKFLNVPKDHL